MLTFTLPYFFLKVKSIRTFRNKGLINFIPFVHMRIDIHQMATGF